MPRSSTSSRSAPRCGRSPATGIRAAARSTTRRLRASRSARARASTTASVAGWEATSSSSCASRRGSTSPARSSGSPTAIASTLEYEETSPDEARKRQTRERLLALLEQATVFFERCLWEGAASAEVRAYVAGRGITEETARAFRLGLSPGRGLTAKARQKGFTATELLATGLANQRGNDYFPYRLDVPARGCARPDRRLPGAQAARRRSAPGEIRQHA